jgi:hypothetical protein
MKTFRLRDADPTLRLFITVFLTVLTAGYAVGLVFVDHTTSATPSGIRERYLGTDADPRARQSGEPDGPVTPGASALSTDAFEPADEMTFAKSPSEMLTLIHNHVLGLSVLFFILGAIFYFSSLAGPRWKRFLMVEPLVGIAATFGGLALVRYVAPEFAWLVIVSGISVGLCSAAMILLILAELWLPPGRET